MTTHTLWVIVYCLATVVFVNRYVAGILLRVIRRNTWDEARDDFAGREHDSILYRKK